MNIFNDIFSIILAIFIINILWGCINKKITIINYN